MSKVDLSRRGILLGRRFVSEEQGATAMEYGLIAGVIALALVQGARRLGRRSNRKMRCVSRKVTKVRAGRKNQPKNNC